MRTVSGSQGLSRRAFRGGMAGLAAGEAYIVEIPLAGIYAVEKIGVPFLTRSLRILTDRGDHRFNALFVGRWYKALRRAISAARVEKNVS